MTAIAPLPRRVSVRMPAKINIALSVGPRREDGFHELATVFHAVSMFDLVSVSERPSGAGVSLTCDAPEVPQDATNLAWRACERMAAELGRGADAHIVIEKGIPTAGGMAGGSTDAAGVLIALNELWHGGLSRERLQEIGAEIGSDVPFCVAGGTQLGTGRGEVLTPVLARGTYHWVVATASTGLSTPEVFRTLDRIRPHADEPHVPEAVMTALRTGDAHALGRALSNDLQPAALTLQPSLRRTLDAGLEGGALGALVSGSGPTCVFLVRDEDHALDVQIAISATGIARTFISAYGPVRPQVL